MFARLTISESARTGQVTRRISSSSTTVLFAAGLNQPADTQLVLSTPTSSASAGQSPALTLVPIAPIGLRS